jgi:hypothetical protein
MSSGDGSGGWTHAMFNPDRERLRVFDETGIDGGRLRLP